MPDGGNSIGVAPRHGVLQECSVFQLGGGVGCLRRLAGGWRRYLTLRTVTLPVSTRCQQGAAESCGNGTGRGSLVNCSSAGKEEGSCA